MQFNACDQVAQIYCVHFTCRKLCGVGFMGLKSWHSDRPSSHINEFFSENLYSTNATQALEEYYNALGYIVLFFYPLMKNGVNILKICGHTKRCGVMPLGMKK